jgi:hypothetical protein
MMSDEQIIKLMESVATLEIKEKEQSEKLETIERRLDALENPRGRRGSSRS